MSRTPAGMLSVIAGGGILYRESGDNVEIALIKRKGVWDLPKGKKEEGESIKQCARREVSEELGIAMPEIDYHIGQSWHEYHEKGDNFLKTTYWYAMRPLAQIDEFIPETEEQIEEVRWTLMENAIVMVAYENLKPVIHQFLRART